MSEDHDILIELKTDVKYIRESVDTMQKSDLAQWREIDSLKGSNRGLWVILSSLLGGGGLIGMVLWALK